jgi:hypothetical protein
LAKLDKTEKYENLKCEIEKTTAVGDGLLYNSSTEVTKSGLFKFSSRP